MSITLLIICLTKVTLQSLLSKSQGIPWPFDSCLNNMWTVLSGLIPCFQTTCRTPAQSFKLEDEARQVGGWRVMHVGVHGSVTWCPLFFDVTVSLRGSTKSRCDNKYNTFFSLRHKLPPEYVFFDTSLFPATFRWALVSPFKLWHSHSALHLLCY